MKKIKGEKLAGEDWARDEMELKAMKRRGVVSSPPVGFIVRGYRVKREQ